ncbi:MAG: VOC family protein [Actinomycetia bacterium]|nr:VOC family protein [Actinomycetes bacterium]
MFKRLIPNLMVEDVNKTIKFYQETLGCFELVRTFPEKGRFDWAMMRCEGADIMFQSRESLSNKIPQFKQMKMGGSMVIYIETEGVKELYSWLTGKAEIVKELHQTSWGRKEFFIKDCNGYTIVFAQ